MSMCNWICEGIGFEQTEIFPLLDSGKLEILINDNNDDGCIVDEKFKENCGYNALTEEEKVMILLEDVVCEEDFQLAGLFVASEGKNSVLIASTNGEGEYYLLYPPKYPWQCQGDFISVEDVIDYYVTLLSSYCRDDVTRQQIIDIIDPDVYEHGWG